MRKAIFFTVAALGVVLLSQMVAYGDETNSNISIQQMDMMPLAFTENHGQWDDRVQFKANAGGATMWFTTDGIYYQFTRRTPAGRSRRDLPYDDLRRANREVCRARSDERSANSSSGRQTSSSAPSDSIEQLVIKALFVGANPNPEISGENMMEYKCNYFIGNDPDEWHTDVPNYKAVVFKDVYAGIDLKYFGNGKQMEYDFIVSPGADPNQIMVQYDGAKSISVNDKGELVVETEWGNVTELRPLVYQFDENGCIPIEGKYVLFTDNTFGFDLGDRYDPTLALVIDPVLSYSTYLGGSYGDAGHDIVVDASGSAYVTGHTVSTDFPTTLSAYDTSYDGGGDAFVTKLSSSGSSLVYSTYLGGSDTDYGHSLTVDDSGAAYVTGFTESPDFPTQNPYQTHQGARDVFITKLSSSGNSLIYSTYLGGSYYDDGWGIAVDDSGAAYVTGFTESFNFPTENPYQMNQGGGDVFMTKLSSTGSSLVYSTYLGGSSFDFGHGIAVDGNGNAYLTGQTTSSDFPTLNPYQTDQGDVDVFVTKLSSSGNSLVYSTYLGGDNWDVGDGIAVDTSGHTYVTGWTQSTDFPTLNPYQGTHQGGYTDVFVTKLSSSGSSLVYGTFLGGGSEEWGSGIVVDGSGAAYVTGITGSTNFPTLNPYQTDQGVYDVFVTKLNNSGDGLVYSTYLGGNGHDFSYGIAVDTSGHTYVTGWTRSTDFPTINPYQTNHAGLDDAFVTKLSEQIIISGNTAIDPDTMFAYYAYAVNPIIAAVYIGDFVGDYAVNDIDPTSVSINGSVDPISTTVIPSHPDFTGEVMEVVFDVRDFILGYEPLWDTTIQQYYVEGLFDDGIPFEGSGELVMIGHRQGDADGSGVVDVDDVVFLVNHIFSGGPAPRPLASGDADCSGFIDIDDVVHLINYIFAGGPPPCDPNDDGVPDC